jgi:hypothetical protein
MSAGIFLGLSLLKRLKHLVADRHRIRQSFQTRRIFLKLLVPKIAVGLAGRQDQVVISERDLLAIGMG